MKALYPIFLKLEGRPVLIAGGGEVALNKARALLPCAPDLTVVAPCLHAELRALAEREPVALIERPFAESDLEGQALVIAATDDAELNHAVVEAARRRGIPANAADDPAYCDFYTGAVVRRGPFVLAIGSEGRFPGLTHALREALDRALPEELGEAADALAGMRSALRAAPLDPARRSQALEALRSWFTREYLSHEENPTP